MAHRKPKNPHTSAPFLGEMGPAAVASSQEQMCFAASHFTVVAVLLVKNLQLKCL